MAWLRSPVLYGAVLILCGLLLRAAEAVPSGAGPTTVEDLRRALQYQRQARPLLALEPHYRPYAFAFIFAGSDAEMEEIKRTIDAELAVAAEIGERGLDGVPEYVAERLPRPDIAIMALGAALLFRSLAFVLATGFAAGMFHELVAQGTLRTGAPSEFYLAAILAALLWCALFWALRALRERRLRFGR